MKIGTMEIAVILLVAFFVLGPGDTVLFIRKLGKKLSKLKLYISSFTEDINETVVEPLREIPNPLQEIQQPLDELKKPLEETMQALRQPLDELGQAVAGAKTAAPETGGSGEASSEVQADGAKKPETEAEPEEPEAAVSLTSDTEETKRHPVTAAEEQRRDASEREARRLRWERARAMAEQKAGHNEQE